MDEPPVHVTADEVHAHAHKTGRPALDMVIALSAIFISAVSLVVAIEHGRTERDLVAANSWPFLRAMLNNGYNDGRDVAIGLSSGGVGPAKLKSLEIFYDGKPVSSSYDLLRRCCGLASDMATRRRQLPHDRTYAIIDESVLRPGEEAAVLVVHKDASAPEIPTRFSDSLLRISFRACYCSVFDECWVSNLRTTTPQRVRRCEPPQHRFEPGGP